MVDNRAVLNMPLGSRNPLDLATLAPGVVGSTGFTGTNFISNGSRNSQSDVLIDGVTVAVQEQNGGVTDVKFRPSVEAVQEFKVQTNSFSAEYGNTGGTVVNLVTRSGTNDVHGSVFEFHRNSALNSNNFFANRSGRELTPFRRNQFGGAIGGPVHIPGIYAGRDRTFFFFHHEGTKQSSQTTTLQTVPTVLQKQGNFGQTRDAAGRLITIYDPFAVTKVGENWVRQPFAGNIIPSNRFNPVAVKALSFYPDPNITGVQYTNANNFFNSGSSTSDAYQTTIKIDHSFTHMQRVSGRYSRSRNTDQAPNLWGNKMNPFDSGGTMNFTQNVSMDYTNTFSPTTILNLRWGVARQFGTRTPFNWGGDTSEYGFAQGLNVEMPPRFEPEGYAAVGTYTWARVLRGEDVNHVSTSMTKVIGRHTTKFGGEGRFFRLNYGQPGVNRATFTFNRRTTMLDPFRADSMQGDGLASMLLGWGSGGSHNTGALSAVASRSYAFFFQDDFQLTDKFTLNLGLRYEYDVPRTERYNRLTWVDLDAVSPLQVPGYQLRGGLQFASEAQRSPYDADTNNWAPRLGFAWQTTPKTVVRGGYGIYYGISIALNRSSLGQGFSTSTNWVTSLDSGITQYASLTNPFPDGISEPPGSSQGLMSYVGRSINGAIRNWAVKPYYQQWSFSIQRELPSNSVVEVAYSGNRGVHLYFAQNGGLNRIDPQYWSLGTALNDMVANPFYGYITDPLSTMSRPTIQRSQLLRPYPQFTGISGDVGPPSANSVYHGLQLRFTKRYSHDLSLSGHYTWSKMIDDSSLGGSLGWMGGDSGGVQSRDNLRLERAVSMYDVAHRAVLDFAYELPFGRGKWLGGSWNRWLDVAIGGWQVNGIVTMQSGAPLVPSLQNGILPDSTQRPNLLRDPSVPGSITDKLNRYVDPTAFSRPEPYTMGTAPRTLTLVRSHAPKNADVSLFKNIYFTGDRDRYVQIRGEAFNLTNTPIFSGPNMSVGSSSFGVISGQANGPRQLQIAMKIYF